MALPKGYPVESHGSMAFFLLQMAIKISVLKKCRNKSFQEVQGRNPRKLSAGLTQNNGPKGKGGSGDINYGHCWYLCEKKTGSYILKYEKL